MYGGAGDDTLIGGGGFSVLVGGDGNDTLRGGKSRNILIGGSGADKLYGNVKDDLFIAGKIDFEDPTIAGNNQMMCSLASIWNDPVKKFNDRAALVQALLANHVSDDGQSDWIDPSFGQGLFFVSSNDKIEILRKGGIVVPV